MNIALILSGGNGSRVCLDTPKQYLLAGGKPILMYCLERVEALQIVEAIVIVASKAWQMRICEWTAQSGLNKIKGFADAGSSRQQSIRNGLEAIEALGAAEDDIVIVHDAARPCVSAELVQACVEAMDGADGVTPVLPVKDTVYQSLDGKYIGGLLDRDQLYAGQAPECYRFGKYMDAHKGLSEAELGAIRGSSEIAFRSGMRIRIIPGDEGNYKITTLADLQKFRSQIEQGIGEKP